ncbi:hypothetical protein GWK41_02600 [Persephonella atlantica]|uniref:DUF1440 domain-containing protein n=1 Tax=Persephonella atlantica TaxID=2699429 RepID=A0ABS1GGA7_9AQUI|nr:hypothetical protein [Persephonella atlantica]MBK3331958.1 hypothetical protein [Persephonella atlantica]
MNLTKGVNIGSVLFAGFVAGYVMYVVDLALDGFLGLFGSYKIYKQWLVDAELFPGFEDIALFLGHQLNGMLFGFFFAYPYVYNRLPSSLILKGGLFAVIWHILVLIVSGITGLLGSKWMSALIHMDVSGHITLFLLHLVWGITLSLFYKPPEEKL